MPEAHLVVLILLFLLGGFFLFLGFYALHLKEREKSKTQKG